MKKHILLSLAAVVIALPVSAQDAPPPSEKPCPCECKCDNHGKSDKHRSDRQHRPKMSPEKRGMMILGEALVMEKYDKDKNGELSEEEIVVIREDMKKAHEARRAEMLKKFDKDGDGKLSKEERKAMREEWEKAHPEVVKKMEERRAEMLKKFDKDDDGKLSREERGAQREEMDDKRPHHPRHGKGMPGKGGTPKPHRGSVHGPVAQAGMDLILEKYDADKDGVLSESENAAMKADAKKAFESKMAERKAKKAAMKDDKEDDMPPPPAPPEDEPEQGEE